MKIALVTDTHLAPAATAFQQNWRAVRTWIDALLPDLLVHLGDITADGVRDPAQFQSVAALFSYLPCKVMFLPGNHDIGDNPPAPGLPGEHPLDLKCLEQYQRVFGPDRWSLELNGWQLIGLNAQLLGTGFREEEEQFAWLTSELGRHSGPVGLLIHKPLFRRSPNDDEVHVRYVPSLPRQRLLSELSTRELRFVASGHAHQARRLTVGGVEHVWVPSASFFIPDEVQERIGYKQVGAMTLALQPAGHHFDLHLPAGIEQHSLLEHADVYPEVAALRERVPPQQSLASMKYLRLRQICLIAPSLAPAVADVRAVLGLEPVYYDPAVAKYGLENAIFAFGWDVLEIVAPIEAGTAAERFLKRSGGRGGYMVILDCDDPERMRRHAEALGIRIANVIDHHPYRGIQLHPRDCRAAMIEFNHTIGGDALNGPYHPGGPSWPQAVRTGTLLEAEIESPNPAELARHWGKIMDRPVSFARADPLIHLDHGSLRFVRPKGGTSECLGGLLIEVPQPDRVRRAAAERGLTDDDGFRLYGVRIRVVG